jgi:hypothetical protein
VTEYWNKCDPGGQAPAKTVVAEQAVHRRVLLVLVLLLVVEVLQEVVSIRDRDVVMSPSCTEMVAKSTRCQSKCEHAATNGSSLTISCCSDPRPAPSATTMKL